MRRKELSNGFIKHTLLAEITLPRPLHDNVSSTLTSREIWTHISSASKPPLYLLFSWASIQLTPRTW